MGKKEYVKNKEKKKSMGDQEVCSMLLTILCKTVAFLEKLISLGPGPQGRQQCTARPVQQHLMTFLLTAVPIKTFQAAERYSVRIWGKICPAREGNQQNSYRRAKERFEKSTV